MLNHKPYLYSKSGIEYSSLFIEALSIPEKLPITAVLSIPILNNKTILVKQSDTHFWDIPGGHIEEGENWKQAVDRELEEEAGITAKHHKIIGYFEITAKPSSPDIKLTYPSPSIILVTQSFVQKYIPNWKKPGDIIDRAIVSFKEVANYIGEREGGEQLAHVLSYAKRELDSIGIVYQFSFVTQDIDFDIPVTQVYGFCKDASSGEFCIVRETGQSHYSLPGGGCNIGEPPELAFRRELIEETLFKAGTVTLVGATQVDMYTPDKITHLQSIFQFRYYTEIKAVVPFIPNKDGFEVEERVFIPFSDLMEKVDWLKTEVGQLVIKEIHKLK